MKKSIRLISILLICILLTSFVVNAENSTSLFSSPASNSSIPTGDGWKQLSYSSNLNGVCGGDVGMWFYASNVQLNSSFVSSNNRKLYVETYEQNENTYNPPYDTFRRYTGYFTGRKVTGWANTFTSSASIETDGTLELCMYYYVEAITGDTSTYVVSGLFKYKYWAY